MVYEWKLHGTHQGLRSITSSALTPVSATVFVLTLDRLVALYSGLARVTDPPRGYRESIPQCNAKTRRPIWRMPGKIHAVLIWSVKLLFVEVNWIKSNVPWRSDMSMYILVISELKAHKLRQDLKLYHPRVTQDCLFFSIKLGMHHLINDVFTRMCDGTKRTRSI